MTPIRISDAEIAGAVVQTVDARDLHAFLEVGKDYSTWIKAQVARARLVEGRDFVKVPQKGELSATGQTRIDYFLTLDAAKHIAMMSGTDKGFEAREYFLACERKAKAPPVVDLRDPATLVSVTMQLLDVNTELRARVETAEKIAVEAVQVVSTLITSEGSLCITDAAKALGHKPGNLFKFLQAHKWIYRRAGGDHWVAYQARLQSGDLEHKLTTYKDSTGADRVSEQVRITPKGMERLAREFPGLKTVA